MHKQSARNLWSTIDLKDEQAIRKLAADLHCTIGELRNAVQRVGPTVADVRNYVARSRAFAARWDAARPRDHHSK